MDYVRVVDLLISEMFNQLPNDQIHFFFLEDILHALAPIPADEVPIMLDYYNFLKTHDIIRLGTVLNQHTPYPGSVHTIRKGQQFTNLGKILLASTKGKIRLRTKFLVEYKYINPVNADDEAGPPAGPVE